MLVLDSESLTVHCYCCGCFSVVLAAARLVENSLLAAIVIVVGVVE